MISPKVKKLLYNVGLPLAGFGIGWLGYNYIEEKGILGHDLQHKLTINNLKAQLYIQRYLPTSITEKYGYPEPVLANIIEQMQKGYVDSNDRMTFEQVLQECDEDEQIGFLEEHASEEIPYFYIADVFNAWAQLHKDVLTAETAKGKSRHDRRYESSLLCKRVWDTLLNDVMPYDVSATCLCILAQKNAANATQLASLVDVDLLVQKYHQYMLSTHARRRAATSSASSVEFTPEQVTGATLLLLKTLNDTAAHRGFFSRFGKTVSSPLPLASRVTSEVWCGAFPDASCASEEYTSSGALHFLDAMEVRMKCQEQAP